MFESRKRLGDMLVEDGVLSEEQLLEVLRKQRATSRKLGDYLVEQGIVDPETIALVLSRQLGIERYEPIRYPLNFELASAVPRSMAEKYQVAPLAIDDEELKLAMVDPMDLNAQDAIEEYIGKDILPVICTRLEIGKIHDGVYGIARQLQGSTDTGSDVMPVLMSEEGEQLNLDAASDEAVRNAEGDAAVVSTVNWLVNQAINENASDIHISPEREYIHVRFRIDGRLREVPPPPKSMFANIIARIKILSKMDISVSMIPQDGRFTVRLLDRLINVRVSSLPTVHGENLVLRLLDASIGVYDLASVGMQPDALQLVRKAVKKPYGMILATGPTGSGKTTTLYSVLRRLNQPDVNIITIEDPVEYRIEKIRQIQLNERAGMTFSKGLRAILRQDPDIIMVGEIRDVETAKLATQAALTGHKLLSTLHTNDATDVLIRLVEMGVAPFVVASTLLISVAQRLVRKVCPNCAVAYLPTNDILERWQIQDPDKASFVETRGCTRCSYTGYRGRTGIFEVLSLNDQLKDMIIRQANANELRNVALKSGALLTLQDDARKKICDGITTFEEAELAVSV